MFLLQNYNDIHKWSHATCVMEEAIEFGSFDEVEGIESLRWEDQQTLRTYINGRVSSESLPFSDPIYAGKLKAQSKALWGLKDNLKKYVSVAELREMLAANDQSTSGREHVLRDRCADGMMFGALKRCPVCTGHLDYSGSTYKCCGDISKWTSCFFSSSHPERTKGKWKIPKQTDNQWLLEWFKSQKGVKPIRLLLAPSSNVTCGDQTSDERHKSSNDENLEDLRVLMVGLPKKTVEEFRSKVEGAGGQVHSYVKKDTNCLVVPDGLSGKQNAMVEKARKTKIPIVREAYLVDCIKRQKKLPSNPYKIEAFGEPSSTVKGRSAVHEDSGLRDSGHILEDGNSFYNTTLSKCDLSSDVNRYYILQIIQDVKGPDCYVFRKWGRIGEENIGSNKLEEISKLDAIEEFKRLFEKKTGNPWETWVNKQEFQKLPHKYFPLDIDYGVSKQAFEEFRNNLSNVETYRAATSESEVNLSEMPLGKPSRSQLQKGIQALSPIKYLLETTVLQPFVKESLIVDLSNRLFTMIPSKHSHVIRDEDDLKTKVKGLKALVDNDAALRRADCGLQPQEPLEWKSLTEISKASSHANGGLAGSSIQANASRNNCYSGRQYITGMKIGDDNFFVSGNFMYFAHP